MLRGKAEEFLQRTDYSGTVDCFSSVFPDLGLEIDLVENPGDPAKFQKKLVADTKAIFIESLTNPFVTIPHLEIIASVAHVHGIPLIVDNTVATPYFLNPFELSKCRRDYPG